MEKITVLTRTYNTGKYICKCVESVLNQTFNDTEKKNCVFLGNAEARRGTYALDQ